MFGAAPIGNQNAVKSRVFGDNIKRYALANDGAKLREITESLFKEAANGDVTAIKEIADRMDGKVKQIIEHAGNDDSPLTIHIQESVALADKIRSLLTTAAELVVSERDSTDQALFGTRPATTGPGVRAAQRPHSSLPTRQVVVKGDKLADYNGSAEVLEP